jgi:hypothetical protein
MSPELAGDRFEEIHHYEFGANDVTLVRLELNTNLGGGRTGSLDVRLVELKVSAGTAADAPALDGSRKGRSRRWLAGAGIIGLTLVLSLGVWVAVRHRRPREEKPAPAAAGEKPARPGPAVPAASVSCSCSGCGKKFRARAELAGKTVKCPQCGQPLSVPAIKSGAAGRAP